MTVPDSGTVPYAGTTRNRGGDRRVIRVVQGGPIMVQGPVSIEMPDGSTVDSDRFMVALCACKRSETYPLCDTSHRGRKKIARRKDSI